MWLKLIYKRGTSKRRLLTWWHTCIDCMNIGSSRGSMISACLFVFRYSFFPPSFLPNLCLYKYMFTSWYFFETLPPSSSTKIPKHQRRKGFCFGGWIYSYGGGGSSAFYHEFQQFNFALMFWWLLLQCSEQPITHLRAFPRRSQREWSPWKQRNECHQGRRWGGGGERGWFRVWFQWRFGEELSLRWRALRWWQNPAIEAPN